MASASRLGTSLLVSVHGIFSGCQSLRDLERFAIRHPMALTSALGIELRPPPSDSAFRYSCPQVDLTVLCAAIRDWTLAQIPGGTGDLDQLVCDGKTMRGSIETASTGSSVFIAHVMLDSAALGVAIGQPCYATGENHEGAVARCQLRWRGLSNSRRTAVLRELLGELDVQGLLIQVDALQTQESLFNSSGSREPTSS
ncbi:MAG: hypothetical protein ACK5QW_10875 [Cyanobacteriota bacterium]